MDDRTKNAKQFIEAIPFSRALRMEIEEIGEGRAVISMPYDPRCVGNPATGVIGGGAVSALMDTCGGAAVASHPKSSAPTATIGLRIDYMRAATPHQRIRATAEVYHVTRSVAFVRAEAHDEDSTRPVAAATGTFTFSMRPGRRRSQAMSRKPPEPIQVVKERRDAALAALAGGVPWIQFLGIQFDRRGDELTGVMCYDEKLIGNPMLPALHGGATAAFLEVVAVVELSWSLVWPLVEEGKLDPLDLSPEKLPPMPKTIDITVDYLRSGLPRDAYARARINRSGRRYASVHVEGWQDNRDRLFAQATGHFLMPDLDS